jgi:HlyD family secretion protein
MAEPVPLSLPSPRGSRSAELQLSSVLDRLTLEPPAASSRWTLYVIAGLFAVLLIWAAIARLDVITIAEGRLVPLTLVKIVQPAEDSVIREILVNDGDSVKAGQVLIRLDTDIVDAERRSTESEIKLHELTLQRIDAELGGAPLMPQMPVDAGLFQQVQSQYLAHRQAYIDALAEQNAILDKTGHDLAASEQMLHKLDQIVPIYRQSADSYAQLAKEGFFNDLAAQEKRRDAIEKEQDLKTQQSTVQSLHAGLEQARRKRDQVGSIYRSDLQNERVRTENELQKFREEHSKSVYRAGLYELKAPQDGVVKDLATTTLGAVIKQGTVLLNLVPKEEPLMADVRIKNEDVGFIVPGQPVQLKLSAYPFQKYGMLRGKVTRIDADVTEVKTNNGSNDQTPTYRAEVKLDTQKLMTPSNEFLSLTPGMLVAAEIRQRDQTVLEYLLSPVEKIAQEAGRER